MPHLFPKAPPHTAPQDLAAGRFVPDGDAALELSALAAQAAHYECEMTAAMLFGQMAWSTS